MSSDDEFRNKTPYYDGDKGWVAPEYNVPTPRFPGKHNPEGGWVLDSAKSFQKGPSGWVSDSFIIEEEIENSPPREHHPSTGKYRAGRRGWVAPDWESTYDPNSGYDSNPNLPVPSSSNQYIKGFSPKVSVCNTEKTVVVEVELPGVSAENVSLEIVSQVCQKVPIAPTDEQAIVARQKATRTSYYLLVRGYKHSKWNSQKVVDERDYGFFERSVFLGSQVNSESPMRASLDDGVLCVWVAKNIPIADK
mmetsp:Transcript_949/g.1522  ORF Transcript_949/g.1522 Transcript_949/m.1522 type:complete len:249 (+) Transcript_949:89-835(+)